MARTCTDINDLKEVEEDLAAHKAQLEEKVSALRHSVEEEEVLLPVVKAAPVHPHHVDAEEAPRAH